MDKTVDKSANVAAYIARCKCGCGGVVVAMVDDDKYKKENAKEVAKLIRQGYAVERSTVGYVRTAPFLCQNRAGSIASLSDSTSTGEEHV